MLEREAAREAYCQHLIELVSRDQVIEDALRDLQEKAAEVEVARQAAQIASELQV